jgi:hypothetical protein
MICETRGHSPYVFRTDVLCHDCCAVLANAETHSKAVGKMLDMPRPWMPATDRRQTLAEHLDEVYCTRQPGEA